MRILGYGLIFLLLLGFLAGGWWMIAPAFDKAARPTMMVAEITLDNRCEVADSSFVVQVVETGLVVSFSEGRARVPLRSDRHVRLVANPAFPDVSYEGSKMAAEAALTLVASCGVSDRLQGVFGAFGNQFKK